MTIFAVHLPHGPYLFSSKEEAEKGYVRVVYAELARRVRTGKHPSSGRKLWNEEVEDARERVMKVEEALGRGDFSPLFSQSDYWYEWFDPRNIKEVWLDEPIPRENVF